MNKEFESEDKPWSPPKREHRGRVARKGFEIHSGGKEYVRYWGEN